MEEGGLMVGMEVDHQDVWGAINETFSSFVRKFGVRKAVRLILGVVFSEG
jgi:hypothetical protein